MWPGRLCQPRSFDHASSTHSEKVAFSRVMKGPMSKHISGMWGRIVVTEGARNPRAGDPLVERERKFPPIGISISQGSWRVDHPGALFRGLISRG